MKFSFIVLVLLSWSSLEAKPFLDITRHGLEQYQDIVIDNKVVKRATNNHNDCKSRYRAIKKVLARFKRPFTLLDLGASQGYYSFRGAFDFPQGVFVMIEGNNVHYPLIGSQLQDLCLANRRLSNVIFLNRSLVPTELETLSQCEHFDVVLALNILHWFKDDWVKMLDAILQMGYCVIVETPPIETCVLQEDNQLRQNIIHSLQQVGAKLLAKVPRHTSQAESCLFLCRGKAAYLKKKTWLSPEMPEKTHKIVCTFRKKLLEKPLYGRPGELAVSQWIPGINLLTFKMYSGTYPKKSVLLKGLRQLRKVSHNDWTINNMIIQGKRLSFIDFNDPEHDPGQVGGTRLCTPSVFASHKELMGILDPEQVREFFWQKLAQD